jgi:hypothetical protein
MCYSKVVGGVALHMCVVAEALTQGSTLHDGNSPDKRRKEASLSDKVCVTIRIAMNSYMFPDY